VVDGLMVEDCEGCLVGRDEEREWMVGGMCGKG